MRKLFHGLRTTSNLKLSDRMLYVVRGPRASGKSVMAAMILETYEALVDEREDARKYIFALSLDDYHIVFRDDKTIWQYKSRANNIAEYFDEIEAAMQDGKIIVIDDVVKKLSDLQNLFVRAVDHGYNMQVITCDPHGDIFQDKKGIRKSLLESDAIEFWSMRTTLVKIRELFAKNRTRRDRDKIENEVLIERPEPKNSTFHQVLEHTSTDTLTLPLVSEPFDKLNPPAPIPVPIGPGGPAAKVDADVVQFLQKTPIESCEAINLEDVIHQEKVFGEPDVQTYYHDDEKEAIQDE